MNSDLDSPVVVGIDGSSSAAAALDTAAVEALALGVPTRVVHAYVWPIFYASLANVPYRSGDWEAPAQIRTMVKATARRTAARHPDLVVESAVVAGAGGPVLVEASADASLVVLGGRGAGGIAGVLAGPVAPFVAAHAHCPVIIVHEGQTTAGVGGRVCVGVDGTASSLRALTFACAWGRRRGADVDVIYAVDPDVFNRTAPELEPRTLPEARLDSWVNPIRHDFPTVTVRPIVVPGPATEELLAASRSARLLVVGSRHRGGLASLVLGSVGHGLIRRSSCPVAVVHGMSASSGDQHARTRAYAARIDNMS
jgi:nucleotide-binding universal stress UspA family protein